MSLQGGDTMGGLVAGGLAYIILVNVLIEVDEFTG